MQFCAITPTPWLEKFDQGPTHMALAHELEDAEYFQYYYGRLAKGNTVILDNGAYEDKHPSFKELIEYIKALEPTYYVLPDEPGDFRLSSMMSLDFLNYLKQHRIQLNSKPLWVVHAEDGDLPNFINSYELGAANAEGICLSRLTGAYGLKDEMSQLRRVQLVDYLKAINKWHPGKYHHCLGLLRGSLCELPYLNARGIHSVDSSAPVWRGLMGYTLDEHWPDFAFCSRPAVWSCSKVEKGIKGEWLASMNLGEVLAACRQSK